MKHLRDEKKQLRDKEKQLRDKEKQLRDEKKWLRDKEDPPAKKQKLGMLTLSCSIYRSPQFI